jgi:hypothetical protein
VILPALPHFSVNLQTTQEVYMNGTPFQVVEQVYEELPQHEPVDLAGSDLEQVSGGICDPGIIIIDK